MSTPTQSYHLPDLLAIISTIPLRTNSHCKPASQSSEKRVLDLGVLNTREAELIHPTKVGLLMALCFPTCDRPQLTLLSEAGMWFLVSSIRSTEQSKQADLWPDLNDDDKREQLDALGLLKRHELLQQLRMFLLYSLIDKFLTFPFFRSLLHDCRIIRLASLDRGSWEDRFKRTLLLHFNAQRMATLCASDNSIPTLDKFLSVRREMLGTSIIFDLAELLEVFPFPEFPHGTQREKLEQIKECAFNIIAWSIDIASYHLIFTPCHFNLLTILMTHNHLSIQGAMNLAGSMIKDAFSSFCILENDLIESLQPPQSILSSISSLFEWKTKTKGQDPSYSNPLDPIRANARLVDVKRYIQALKDCIAGSMHWVYETELFFGKKGGEVRSFGWVFAHMKYMESGNLEHPPAH